MPFHDRVEAGRRLAAALGRFKGQPTVVFALPRGGVPVAAEIAAALGAPLDLVLCRKIGVPLEEELAMGAVADGGEAITVRNDDVIGLYGIDAATFEAVRDKQLREIERRRRAYLGDRPPAPVAGRIAIVVDDGIATGATTRAALRAVRARRPSKLVLAVPVAPTDVLASLRGEADEIVCLEDHRLFGAIGLFYARFPQISDDEVVEILARFPPPAGD